MQIPILPPPEERKALLAMHAHRYPERFDFTMVGDGGAPAVVTVLLGNPTGACKMPDRQSVSEAWEMAVAATFKPNSHTVDVPLLVSDCVLWPAPLEWSALVLRWPALPSTVGRALRQKYGGATSMLAAPIGKAPEGVATIQSTSPAAVWRQLAPTGALIDVALCPPDVSAWQLFEDELKKPEAKCWDLALDLANACVAWSSMPIADVFARWPGLALLVAVEASHLGGMGAKFEKGEF